MSYGFIQHERISKLLGMKCDHAMSLSFFKIQKARGVCNENKENKKDYTIKLKIYNGRKEFIERLC